MIETTILKRIYLNCMVEICLVVLGIFLLCFVFFHKKKGKQRYRKLHRFQVILLITKGRSNWFYLS